MREVILPAILTHRSAMTTRTTTASESPREIYLAACAEISAHFADRGFRFAKSGPHASKRSGDFTYQIGYQSGRRNAAGVSVTLWIHGRVLSKRLREWRSTQPRLGERDGVAGGQIGNLTHDSDWYSWNLADPTTRESTIDSAIATIESVALPYFAQFDNLPELILTLQQSDVPSMCIEGAVEFLMCFADQHAARTAAVNFLHRRPDLVRSYQRDFQRYAERGLDWSHPSGYAKQLAFASHLFHFGDLTQGGA